MKYKYFLPLLFVLASSMAVCQEKFIEVTVSDTVWITPNQFIYAISPTNFNDRFNSDATLGDNPSKDEKSKTGTGGTQNFLIDSLRGVITTKGFRILPQDMEDGSLTYNEVKLGLIQVFTTSVDSMEMVYKLIENNSNFYGFIAWAKATDEEVYTKKLSQKLIAMAKDKAARKAALKHLKIGNIVSIKDVTAKETGWTAYPPLSSLGRNTTPNPYANLYPNNNYHNAKSGTNNQYQLKNSLIVRFSVQ